MRRICIWLFLLLSVVIVFSCANSGGRKFSADKDTSVNNKNREGLGGAYIITVKYYCDEFVLRKFFYEYGILEIHQINDKTFLIKFASDPGLHELRNEAEKTNSIEQIQPHNLN